MLNANENEKTINDCISEILARIEKDRNPNKLVEEAKKRGEQNE